MFQRLLNSVRTHRWFFLFVGIPFLLTSLYYGLIASDVYVSESRFVIKAPSQKSSQISTLANLIQTTGLSSGQEQASEVMDYIRSRAALEQLDRTTKVEALFSRPEADFLSRYPAPWDEPRRENLFDYYKSMVVVSTDHDTGVVVLRTKAFRAEDAHTLNGRLLAQSEALINDLNRRARQRGISEAQENVKSAEVRVRAARVALSKFRSSVELLDPVRQAGGVLEISNKLITERAALTAQIDLMERVAPDNPALPAMRANLSALSREIEALNQRAVGPPSALASKAASYDALQLEQEFATQMLTAANAALEQARAEALKQQFYLERVSEPNKPDVAELPHRLKMTLTILGALLSLYFIGWMFVVGILEHAPEH